MPGQASAEKVHQEVEKVLSSRGFARNERMGRFLRFVVEQQLEGKAAQLKETLIGAEVFGRKPDYDPKLDPIVRTEAARLRVRLAEYYAGDGAKDPVVIALPKGGYAPVIRSHGEPIARRGVLWRALQARPRRKAAIAAGLLALVGVGWWIVRPKPERPVIAVLPFKNLSAEPESEFFVDGLTDEIIRNLSMIDGMEVKSRTSSFAFKDKSPNIRDVGERLRANLVLEGSVLRSGGRLRVTTQLIRVSDDHHLWSDRFERELKDVFAIQDEISRAIVGELRLKLPAPRKKWPPTESPEAYTFYMRGRSALEPTTAASAKTALQFFERAIALDPEYAQAHAGVAEAYHLLAFTGVLPAKEAYPKAAQGARKALSRDESLSEAHSALAHLKYVYEWDWSSAEREFRRAIVLNPNSASAHENYGIMLSLQGRFDEGLEQIRLAESLDPLSARTRWLHASVLYYARRYEESLVESRRTLEMDPSYSRAHQMVGQCYLQQGRLSEAIEEFLRGSTPDYGNLGRAYALAGRTEEARKVISDLRRRYEQRHVGAGGVARVYIGLGDFEQAFQWLEKDYEDRDYLVTLKVAPVFDPLRSDPRFDHLLRRVGLLTTAAPSRASHN